MDYYNKDKYSDFECYMQFSGNDLVIYLPDREIRLEDCGNKIQEINKTKIYKQYVKYLT